MKIGEIAKLTDISESTLRYYERKELIRVFRDGNNRREYREEDIEWIRFIQRLKDTGMLLKNIQRYSELRYIGESTIKERLAILEKHQIFVNEEREKWNLYEQNLNKKINFYRKKLEI